MNIDEIMTLVKAVSDSTLTSFELEEGELKISLKREKEKVKNQAAPVADPALVLAQAQLLSAAGQAAPVLAAPSAALQAASSVQAVSSVQAAASAGAAASAHEDIGSDNVITSPLVGTFYSSSSPDAEPFVKAGDTVKKGQVLGIIEAMKLMNEIESEYDGVVEAILVNNEDVVEYGQPLFRIR